MVILNHSFPFLSVGLYQKLSAILNRATHLASGIVCTFKNSNRKHSSKVKHKIGNNIKRIIQTETIHDPILMRANILTDVETDNSKNEQLAKETFKL